MIKPPAVLPASRPRPSGLEEGPLGLHSDVLSILLPPPFVPAEPKWGVVPIRIVVWWLTIKTTTTNCNTDTSKPTRSQKSLKNIFEVLVQPSKVLELLWFNLETSKPSPGHAQNAPFLVAI